MVILYCKRQCREKDCSTNVSVKHDTLAPRISGPYQDGCYPNVAGHEKIHFKAQDASGMTLTYSYLYKDGRGQCVGTTTLVRNYTGDIPDGFKCLDNKIKIINISAVDTAGNKTIKDDTDWLDRSC